MPSGPSLISILLLSLSHSLTYALPASIWEISIDESPAPPPDKGPPLSANASRDPSKIPYQVVGIIAAYIFCLVLATVAILVGKRLRRKIQTSDQSLNMEMVKPSPKVNHPLSPRREGYKPWSLGHKSKLSQISVSTVNEVVEQDKARNMEEMERLYAAVMAHDDHTSEEARSDTAQPLVQPQTQRPTELQHLRDVTPKNEPILHPMAPTPIEEDFQGLTIARSLVDSRSTSRPSPMSFLSGHSRGNSGNSTRSRPSRISIRGSSISNPMGSPDLRDSAAYSEEAPLSPRIYTPGPPPPIPGQKSAAAQAREVDGQRRTPNIPSLRGTTANNSSGSLPFRQAYADSMKSAPPTKTTFLDKRELHSGPKTGVPFTPYSPYMPYTPLTPVTPRRLVTKSEMKRDKKKEAMKVVNEDDLVQSDDDMWSTVR